MEGEEKEGKAKLHILMLPWLAMGHLLPFLELSKALAVKGHRISFLTTPRNRSRLPAFPPHLIPSINFIDLTLPAVHPLPENAESTMDLPSDALRPHLRIAFDALQQPLADLLPRISPSLDCIVFDYAAHWIPSMAARSGLPCAFFALHNAAAMSFFGPPSALIAARTSPQEFTVSPPWIPFPSPIVYKDYEARALFAPGLLPDASGVSESRRYGDSVEGCQLVLIRSCDAFEGRWLNLLRRIYRKPVVPAGLLPPASKAADGEILDWLEKQEEGSAVYAAFGSEAKLTAAQTDEIAVGLELSGLPFVWALRDGGAPAAMTSRGLVYEGWAPQTRILAHPSIGGFLMHGGWGSIVEAMAFGKVMVVLPMMFDQGLNARNLAERGIAVEVLRNEDGSFTGDAIAKSLRLAMVEDEGEGLRAKARECRDCMFGEEELCLRQLIEHLGRLRRGQW